MKKFMDSKWGKRIEEVVAFEINFDFMIYGYDDKCPDDYYEEICSRCGKEIQIKDYEAPRSSCKREYGILDILHFGVNEELKTVLIENQNFNITENDFRPIRNKKGNIVYYQITPEHTMLPISNVNPWRKLKNCKKCGNVQYRRKEMYNDKDEEYYFTSREALDEMHDINITYEHFQMYYPLVVVSRRVYDFLSDKYPRMKFRPFFLKEEN